LWLLFWFFFVVDCYCCYHYHQLLFIIMVGITAAAQVQSPDEIAATWSRVRCAYLDAVAPHRGFGYGLELVDFFGDFGRCYSGNMDSIWIIDGL
jgi:hypothetical protein